MRSGSFIIVAIRNLVRMRCVAGSQKQAKNIGAEPATWSRSEARFDAFVKQATPIRPVERG